jgi:hypothetical protein
LSTLGSDEDDQVASFPSLGQSSQPPPANRSPTLKTPPPVSYVTAVRPATTPNTSDITATHATSTDFQLQFQMLLQSQQETAQAHAKEIAELKALVMMQATAAPKGLQGAADSNPDSEPIVEAIKPPPTIE